MCALSKFIRRIDVCIEFFDPNRALHILQYLCNLIEGHIGPWKANL